MSNIVNKALANLLTSQHQTNRVVEELGLAVQRLSVQGDSQLVLIQELINAMETQSQNSVPLRQKVAEIEQRLAEVERKVS